jgi:hypothetical protein
MSMAFGPVGLRAVSESRALRPLLEDRLGWELGMRPFKFGLLLGRPAAEAAVGKGFWVVYESGSVVLRRTTSEEDAVRAAAFHLVALRSAIDSPLLPLRVKTVLLPSGGALLAGADAVYSVPGHDRSLARRGCTVVPTSVALVDPATLEIVLPEQDLDPDVPVGRRPIERIALPTSGDRPVDAVSIVLAFARSVLRDPDRDLQRVLEQLAQVIDADPGLVELMPSVEIGALVNRPGGAPGS